MIKDDLKINPSPGGHEHPRPYLRILVAFDGSANSWRALERAIEIAEEHHGLLTVAGVALDPPGWIGAGPYATGITTEQLRTEIERELTRALAAARDEIPATVGVRTVVLHGRNAARAISKEIREGQYDLLVTGPRGLGGGPFRRSVTKALLKQAPISVLAVRDEVPRVSRR